MDDSTFVTIAAVLVAAGYVGGSKRWAPAVPVTLWAAGFGIAAALGAFRPTGENNSLGLIFFAAVPASVWFGCAEFGIGLRRFRRRRHPRHRNSTRTRPEAGAAADSA